MVKFYCIIHSASFSGQCNFDMVNEDPALSISDLAFQFDAETGPILRIKSWQVDRGKQVFLQGASGSGKSSLLTLLAGLQVPTMGEVEYLEQRSQI